MQQPADRFCKAVLPDISHGAFAKGLPILLSQRLGRIIVGAVKPETGGFLTHIKAKNIKHCQISQMRKEQLLGPSRVFNSHDEDQIGEPFYKFQQLKRTDEPAAIHAFSQFKTALTRRMASEESDLLPSFEARVGKHARSICATMRQEHEQIRGILNEIELKLSRSVFATEAEERALEAALIAHNHRETRVVYSAME